MGRFFVGTSGFSYPHWGNGLFYPKDLPRAKWFEYYLRHFKAVELNVSFYRLPKKEVFAGWRKKAGPDFVFSVKGSRYITHVKKLKDCQEAVERFFEATGGLKGGADVVLWQLPPNFRVNKERLSSFLKILPKGWRYAFEFRHESWLSDEIDELLKKYQAAVVFQDFPDWPVTEKVTADFIYLRFHGKTSLYSSCYTERELTGWAKKIKNWLKKGRDCYAFFNNDALGYAVENAKELKKILYETAQT
jgi:uncharacterized protein YecE (DUF72 family)